MTKSIEAGASVTQSEPVEYRPLPIKYKDPEEEELIKAAQRDRESFVLVNGHPEEPASDAPKEINPMKMLERFIKGEKVL